MTDPNLISDAPTAASIQDWLVGRIADLRGVDARSVRPEQRFTRHDLDSLAVTQLLGELSRHLGRPVPPTAAWAHPTPAALANHLAGGVPSDRESRTTARVPVAEPVAIIGLACRLPGADSPEELWTLLTEGRDAVRDVPSERWSVEEWYDPDPAEAGKIATRRGGFLRSIDGFDPRFFGIAPSEARHMDPQQRLMLELAWEALADAGIRPSSLRGRSVGVFVGAMWTEYAALLGADPGQLGQHSATGGDTSIISARISYTLGLTGPSITVNTACSSSLVALHQARRSLAAGECDLALAGGVSLMTTPTGSVAMSRFGAMAPDGRCKSFDADADGYVRGEGGGLVVLKPLSAARADGDRPYCTVIGGAVNNDGFSNGLTAPSPGAQEAVIRAACADAGVDPVDVDFVETHGTGTRLGDPIEAGALGAVYGAGRPADRPLLLGAVKTNLGHLEAAAGVAGLIKTALALRHGQIPGNLHFHRPSPHIPFEQLRLEIPTTLRPWPQRDTTGESPQRREGAPGDADRREGALRGMPQRREGALGDADRREGAFGDVPHRREGALGDADRREGALRDMAQRREGALRGTGHRSQVPTASQHGPVLAGVSSFGFGGTNCHILLASAQPLESTRESPEPPSRPVFVFGGQGSQWAGAGAELMAEPAFARAVRDCDRAMAPYLPGSVAEALTQRDDWLHDTAWVQPVIFTVQVALAALWESWGVRPAAVVGSSIGEVAAAYVSGALSLDDAARVICLGSRLVGQTEGAMAVVELGAEELRAEPGVHIAVLSSPGRTGVSGAAEDLDRACAAWERQGVTVRRVAIDYASHSPLMDPLLPELRQQLAGLLPGPTHIPFWSTVTAGPMQGVELDADYWCRNMREPVRFAPTVTRLADEGATFFLDVNPHPIALRDLNECVPHGQSLPSLRRDEPEVIHSSAAALGLPAAVPAETLLPISAHTEPALRAAAADMADRLRGADSRELVRVCHTAAVHRDHHEFRLAVVAESPGEHVAALDEPAGHVRRAHAPARAVFVFPGQGGQFPDMGIDLYRDEPVFRRTAHRCAQLIRGESGIDLLPWLEGKPLGEDAGIDTIQPALFTIGVALAALWRSWGVEPVAVVGHSMGEAAAAHVCGVLSLPDAVKVICRRSAVYARLAGRGAMALVELTHQQALEAIGDTLEVAALNGSRSTVLTGEPDAIDAVIESVRATGALARRVPVDAAAHSRQVEPLLDEFRLALTGVEPRSATVPFISTVTGAEHTGLDAAYWARNLREPVRFTDAIAHISGHAVFLELGPHPVLAPAIEKPAVAALHRDKADRRALLEALAALYAHGVDLDWDRLPLPVGHRTSLPAYPWQRERYWITDETPTTEPIPEPPNLAQRLRQAPEEAVEDVRRYLTARLASLLGVAPADVPPDKAPAALGATSLMAMELRNLLHAECGVEVLVSQVLQTPGLGELSQAVAELAGQATTDIEAEDVEVLL